MPRMDGFQFLEAYSHKVTVDERVPIIIFSGKDMTQTQREMLNNFDNVIGVFAKGFANPHFVHSGTSRGRGKR